MHTYTGASCSEQAPLAAEVTNKGGAETRPIGDRAQNLILRLAGHVRLRHKHRRTVVGIQTIRCTASANGTLQGPVVLVDNYDSFTYNLSQVLPYC